MLIWQIQVPIYLKQNPICNLKKKLKPISTVALWWGQGTWVTYFLKNQALFTFKKEKEKGKKEEKLEGETSFTQKYYNGISLW